MAQSIKDRAEDLALQHGVAIEYIGKKNFRKEGRVAHILRQHEPGPDAPGAVCFGGADGDTLFAACGDRIFKRKLKVKGAFPFQPPIKPGKPRL